MTQSKSARKQWLAIRSAATNQSKPALQSKNWLQTSGLFQASNQKTKNKFDAWIPRLRLFLKAHWVDFDMKNIHWARNFNHLVKKTSDFFHRGESNIRSLGLGLFKNALSNNRFFLGYQKFSISIVLDSVFQPGYWPGCILLGHWCRSVYLHSFKRIIRKLLEFTIMVKIYWGFRLFHRFIFGI